MCEWFVQFRGFYWVYYNELQLILKIICRVGVYYIKCIIVECELGSSVSIVSGYGLDDRAIEVQSPAEAKGFFLQPLSRLALGPTQPPVQWVPGVLSPGLKHDKGVMLTTHHI
jgi:hypothetical protein